MIYNKNILIADDDENFLEIYESILTTKALTAFMKDKTPDDYIIKTFSDGKYLWNYFKEEYKIGNRIPLAILDMKMPRMDGLTTAKKLREIDSEVVIVIVTAYEDVTIKTIKENLEKDIYYIKKPFNKEELYCLVDSLIKGWNKNIRLGENDRALRSSQKMLQLVLDSIPARVFWKDKDSVFLGCNRLFAQDAGFLYPEEITGKNDYEMPWKKEETDFFRECDRKVMERDEAEHHIIEPLSRADGTKSWLDTTKIPLHNTEGKVVGILGIYEDITEKVKAEEELKKYREHLEDLIEERTSQLKKTNELLRIEIAERRKAEEEIRISEARYRELINHMSSGVAVYRAIDDGHDFIFTDFNRSAEKIDNIKKEKVIGKPVTFVFPGIKDFGLLKILKRVWQTGKPEYFPPTLYKDERVTGWRENYIYKLPSGEIVAVYDDVTEKKEIEEALKVGERNFRNLSGEYNSFLEAIPDILLVLDSEMGVIWANNMALLKIGRGESILKKHCNDAICNKKEPCISCPVKRCFSTGETQTEQILTSDDRYMDLKVSPIKDEEGHVCKVILVAGDVTEKVLFQKETLRTSHLASLGELAAGVAHEINNPINGIINYAQIIADMNKEESDENIISQNIIKEGRRIAIIVKNLLSFARRDSPDKIPVKVGRILSDSVSLTGLKMTKEGIKIKTDVPPDLPEVMAQPVQLQQVFINILINARDALNKKYPRSHKDKIIEIAGEHRIIDGSSTVSITICDYGCGIHSGIQNKIINPFFTTKPPGEGTGLGLSISYGIISDHGGKILIDSVEDKFTRVIINLPAIEE